ncbi:hypothetical protein [Parendozoicomonas haliclonae]|uniref:Lysozyme inhibitor LprI N-terminal domain-containing protein n=1 Tax=Parendozoicomonas haliclonae TaxID=1960125 RepID=A0A1X7AIE3_9GAMM|nr:hypothetical protein [Parendozoicomonas haliclonae]SMA45043.1 hypothetical protein EHSB41UT_01831 [Parendozoicomonas haliclonae]
MHQFRDRVKALTYSLSALLILALSPAVLADNHVNQHASQPLTLCEKMRMERQHEINRNPDIDLLVPLRQSSDANCFSPAENLYFVSLVAAEAKLGPNSPWYQTMGEENRGKAKLACEVMGYAESPQTMTMDECIAARYNEMMQPYNDEYRNESTDYINKRNALGEELVEQCVTAFYQNLPNLPRQIQFPLAYYDRKLHAYPDWYLEARLNDNDWLMNMQKTMASQVIGEALDKQCPGDMIWWLYLST